MAFPHDGKKFSSDYQPEHNGHPEGTTIRTILKKLLALPTAQRIKSLPELSEIIGDTSHLTNFEAITLRLLAKALANPESKSMERLLNRLEGLPKQPIEHSGEIKSDKPDLSKFTEEELKTWLMLNDKATG